MNILFISRWFPYPPDNGSKIRVFNLLKNLSFRHNITLLSFSNEPKNKDRVNEMKRYCCSVRTVPYRKFKPKRLRALIGFFSMRPRSLIDTFSKDMQVIVDQEIQSKTFDVAIASEIDSVPYALLIDKVPLVLEEIELSCIYEQFAKEQSILLKIRYGLTWWKTSRFISKALDKFDGFTVVSERELCLIDKVKPKCDIFSIVPNATDLAKNNSEVSLPKRNILIYPGAISYEANYDAVYFFLNQIFPLITSEDQDVIMLVTGDYEDAHKNTLPFNERVRYTGYLDDVRQAIAQSWGCVVPLRIGGGTRLKILEAMAVGTPVVSTSKGAEGLQVVNEKNILIADNPRDFAKTVLRLLKDTNLRNHLSKNGRRLVAEKYTWAKSANKLDDFLTSIHQQKVNKKPDASLF